MENNVLAFNQALAAGELVAVDDVAKDVGFAWPVGVAKAVYGAVNKQSAGNVADGLWELLFAARIQAMEAARTNADLSELPVSAVVGVRRGQGVTVYAQLLVGIDESTQEPCVVLLKPPFLEKSDAPA
jgi:hypothetical protein